LPDLESFFSKLEKKIKKLDRKKDYSEFIKAVKENSREIREKILKYLMVRRTRTEIIKYFSEDLVNQSLKFPEVNNPDPLYYQLNEIEDKIFNDTIKLIVQKFKYARYMPMLYYKGKIDQLEEQSQKNMGKFMKILLVKRLESSFFAFRNSLERFINSYEVFIREYEKGNVYTSKKYASKIFEFLENDDDESIQRLIDEGKVERYKSEDFEVTFMKDLQSDLKILQEVKALWQSVTRDPKLIRFLNDLSQNNVLKNNKLVVFTESKETAEYLYKNIKQELTNEVLCFTGGSGAATREKVIENFDANARFPKDDYRILISTEVLSEGVNLHRSNVVINYDIPWNPTRMMQRVGRINRVDTKFDKIYTYNFFPTRQSNDEIKLKEAAEAKINAFLTLLGGDAALLTEGEPISSHELFDRLISKQVITGEDETEETDLKYLQFIRNIRDNDPDLFEKIKHLPKKARSAKLMEAHADSLLTYFRKGKLQKFYIATDVNEAQELDFLTAAQVIESEVNTPKNRLLGELYALLDKNKQAFINSTLIEIPELKLRGGRDSATNIIKILKATMKNTKQFTDEQEIYLQKAMKQLEEGGLPKQTTKETLKALNKIGQDLMNPLKVLAVLQNNIPERLLESHYAENNPAFFGRREVILSLYLAGE